MQTRLRRIRRALARRGAGAVLAMGGLLVALALGAALVDPDALSGLDRELTRGTPIATGLGSFPSAAATAPAVTPMPTSAPSSAPNGAALAAHPPDGFALHVPVLMYHRIVPSSVAGSSLPDLVVSPQAFDAQMTALQQAGWHSITLAQLATDLREGIRPASKTFVATFDDGWWDGYAYAMPILRQHGFTGTFFVITGRTSDGSFLSPGELEVMAADGMEIADHTESHVDLVTQPPTSAFAQITGARDAIDGWLGAPPTTFAYPFGAHDPLVVHDVSLAGFQMAVTTVEGCLETWANRLVVPRVRVGPATTAAELVSLMTRCEAGGSITSTTKAPAGAG